MKQRCDNFSVKPHALLFTFILLLLSLVVSNNANAGSTARVSTVDGDNIIIDLANEAAPAKGDTVEVSFGLGGEKFVIGTWRITLVQGKKAVASKIKAELAAEPGMAVHIKQATAANNAQETANAEEELFWLKESQQKTTTPTNDTTAQGQEELFWLDKSQQPATQSAIVTSGDLEFTRTSQYKRVWTDKGSGARRDFAVWRPVGRDGFYPLGDVVNASPWPGDRYPTPSVSTILVKNGVPPVSYQKIWSSYRSGSKKPFSSWMPIAPEGYQCLGDVGSQSENAMPPLDAIRCLPASCITQINLEQKIWDDKGSGAKLDFSAWLIPKSNTYAGNASHSKPKRVVYMISDVCFR